ncbi:hypothetical protein [Thermococcus gorgonarius]|uniref:Uncharacterized protein n=1 Tax=Thermococcus gorgonarius TaxID=71997 RepID=A0A2Z2M681_THEGO|nr:hypothetical protein [Thermococcus gorgonarius]ASJ00723.1 hypothetical protein A3K92_04140 [Thermococcus gorgonarius]
MKWRLLLAVLLGLLVGGMATGSSYIPVQKPIYPAPPQGALTKVFTGPDASLHAHSFVKGKEVTLAINFSAIKDATFIGIALRPIGNGAYAPAYYVVQGAEPNDYPRLQRKFEEFAETHFRTQVSNIKIASAIEPNVNWNYAGSIDWVTSTSSLFGQKGVLELKGFYYYYPIDSNTIEYYAKTRVRGDVSSSDVALKDLRLRVSTGGTYEALEDFLPDGHMGPMTSYSEAITVELDSEKTAQISASAGYSVNTNDGYYFRMDTHTLDPNNYVDFHAYDFKKDVPWLPDPPAFGMPFFFESAVTMKVKSPTNNACYFGIFNYDASAEFYVINTWLLGMPVTFPPYLVTAPKDIKISVFVYPPHTVFHS